MHLVRPRGAALAEDLGRLTAPDRVSTRLPDRTAYARDLWVRGLIGARSGDMGAHPPEAVVWPATVEEVQAVVRWAAERGVPIVPFGAGSGVSGGTVPTSGGVVIDLKRMRRLLALDRERLTATFETGIIGEHLEHELARRGYTLGHFPSSIMCSTLGGWLAARSAGQCSSRYGKIEDMVRWVEVVLGTGEVVRTADPAGRGPDFTQLLVGSEGTLGILTQAEMRIQPLAEARYLRGFSFPDLAAGCDAMRRVMQARLRPFVMRLYDELDTFIAMRARHAEPEESAPDQPMEPLSGAALLFERIDPTKGPMGGQARAGHGQGSHPSHDWWNALGGARLRQAGRDLRRWATSLALSRPELTNQAVDVLLPYISGGCLMVVGVEGDRALAQAEWRAVEQELVKAGGSDLGPGPGERWLRRRYAINFGLSKVFDAGGFADTMEIATTWDRLLELHAAVRSAVAPHATVMAHFSHTYPEGCSIYYTFAATEPGGAPGAGGGSNREAQERRYDTIWREAMLATTRVGGTISHHHGIGLLKAPFMAGEHGEGMRVFRALKAALDPHDVCNPGKLGLEIGAAEAPAPAPAQTSSGLGEVRAALSLAMGGAGDRLSDEADGAAEVAALHGSPTSAAAVVAVLEAAAGHACPVVIGNGPWPARPHLRLDLGGMTGILEVSERSLLVHAQAGIRLGELEEALAARGLTLGPLLPRAHGRRLGAALAAPRPSEASPRGRLLDACAALEAALFTGALEGARAALLVTRLAPRRATGPAFEHVFLGAHGRTGVITSAWLRVMRKASSIAACGWMLPSRAAAFEVAQRLLDRGGRPAVLALVDVESVEGAALAEAGAKAGDVVLLARCEGAEALVQAERALLGELAQAAGGVALDPEWVSSWLAEPPAPPQGERFVPRTELPAAWVSCPRGSWLWALCPAGATLLTETEAPTEPASDRPGPGEGAPVASLSESPSGPLAGIRDELARRLDPGSLLQANAHDA
ncbi:MAG TPA: FAD-binding protein [Polyangia bacterium]|nr:FAD-binding protein [Polyangia bacterium]